MSENTEQPQQTKQLFITPELTHRIELILHLLEHSNQLIIVKGDSDSGKTTLLKEIIKQDNSSLDIKTISITNNFSFEQFELSLWAAEARDKQKVPALLLDNIDQMELNEFNNLKSLIEDKVDIRFCLFCLPTFIETLDQFLQDSPESGEQHLIDIPPLTQDQTLLYIRNIYSDNPFKSSQFDDELARQIYQFNHGLPGKIDKYCEQYLNDPALLPEDQRKRYLPFIFGALTGLFVLFALFVLFFVTGETGIKQEKIKIKLEVPKPEIIKTEQIAPTPDDAIETTINSIENEMEAAIPEITKEIIETDEEITQEQKETASIETPEIAWLIQQNPEKYVLQLLGAQERKTIDLYRNSFADPDDQLRVITTLKEGKEWHILLYGLYEDRESAKDAIRRLPARAKKLSPWPRTISSIIDQVN